MSLPYFLAQHSNEDEQHIGFGIKILRISVDP